MPSFLQKVTQQAMRWQGWAALAPFALAIGTLAVLRELYRRECRSDVLAILRA